MINLIKYFSLSGFKIVHVILLKALVRDLSKQRKKISLFLRYIVFSQPNENKKFRTS